MKRIGGYTWATQETVCGFLASLFILAIAAWFWRLFRADPVLAPFALPAIALGLIVFAVGGLVWTASRAVLWFEIGERLTIATLPRRDDVPWEEVEAIEIERGSDTVPPVVLPLALFLEEHVVALFVLGDGRELRAKIDPADVSVLETVMRRHPRLDRRFGRALSSPRRTVMTFVDAVMERDLDHAGKFLDFSRFDPSTADRLAAPCAKKLKQVIDRMWLIDFDEIPDEADHPSPYTLADGTRQRIDPEKAPVLRSIRLSRDQQSGNWRFDPETVEMIVQEFIGGV